LKVRQPYYGINKCKPTEPSLTINQIIHDNRKGICMLIDVAISGCRNVIKKGAEKTLKYNGNTVHVKCKNESDTSNNSSN
jgi:hypothetical protein